MNATLQHSEQRLINHGFGKVSLRGMHPETAQMVADELIRLARQYGIPVQAVKIGTMWVSDLRLAEVSCAVITGASHEEAERVRALGMTAFRDSKGTYRYTNRNMVQILFAVQRRKRSTAFGLAPGMFGKKFGRYGFHPRTDNPVLQVTRHEFCHVIQFFTFGPAESRQKEARARFDPTVAAQISIYAEEQANFFEVQAEAFSMYEDGRREDVVVHILKGIIQA